MTGLAPESLSAPTIPSALRRSALLHASTVAINDGEMVLDYAALDAEVDRLASGLVAAGVAPGEPIAVWSPNSGAFVIAAMAVYRASSILVPISSRYKGEEAADILRRSGAVALFTVTDFLESDPLSMLASQPPLPDLRIRIVMSGRVPVGAVSLREVVNAATDGAREEMLEREAAIGEDDTSDLIFTSGTTGRPKGALLRHGASVRTYEQWSARVGLRAGDRYLVVFPMFHTSGLKAGVLACILRGASIHPQAVFDVDAIVQRVAEERITMLPGPPTVFQTLLAHPGRAEFDLSSIRSSVTGAAVVPEEIIRRMRDDLGIPDVVTGYGLTETTGTVSMCSFDDPAEVVATTVGHPLEGIEVRVVDENGVDVAPESPGELWVRGFNVMVGYHDDPKSTAEAITVDGWLKTGDIGLVDATGRIHITDRKKDMFIVGGFNSYPAEIESRLLEHPDIVQAAVLGVPDERLGEVGAALLVLRPEGDLVAASLSDDLTPWCRERMANFKVPRRFVAVEELPLNATGKIARAELRRDYLE